MGRVHESPRNREFEIPRKPRHPKIEKTDKRRSRIGAHPDDNDHPSYPPAAVAALEQEDGVARDAVPALVMPQDLTATRNQFSRLVTPRERSLPEENGPRHSLSPTLLSLIESSV
jgi:hypothetical protein